MFHRPKNEDTQPEAGTAPDLAARQREANEKAPIQSFAGIRTLTAADAPKAAATPTTITTAKPAAVSAAPITQSATQSVNKPINTPTTTPITPPQEKLMSTNDEQSKQQPSRPLDIPGSSANYQPQPAARAPGAYSTGASYPTAPGYASQPVSSAVAKPAQGRRLVIGEGITLSGEIEACEFLVIEGTVEASLKGASVLEIAESGTFYGAVEIDEATVSGRFEGEITVNGRLTITASGSVTGSISYKELAIEAGATLDGKVSPLSGSKVTAKKPEPKAAKVKGPRNDNAGETGSELPFSASTAASA